MSVCLRVSKWSTQLLPLRVPASPPLPLLLMALACVRVMPAKKKKSKKKAFNCLKQSLFSLSDFLNNSVCHKCRARHPEWSETKRGRTVTKGFPVKAWA